MKSSNIAFLIKVLIVVSVLLTISCTTDPVVDPVENQPPDTPSNPSPAAGAVDVSIDVDLSWTCSDPDGDPLVYTVYFGTDLDPPRVDSDPQTTYDPGTLDNNTVYYWKIEAYDQYSAETVSGPVWSFFTEGSEGNQPPNIPSNPYPPHQADRVSIEVDLSWDCTDPDGDPLVYIVYFGTDVNPPHVDSDPQTTYDPGILETLTTYYWRIVAYDQFSGEPVSGPVWSFSTGEGTQPPNIPSNPYPPHQADRVSIEVDLSWTCIDPDGDELTYNVFFGTASDPPPVGSPQSQATYDPGILESNTTYYWKIEASDPDGETAIGPVWSFSTEEENQPPNIPSNPSPADDAEDVSIEVDLSWDCTDPDGDELTYNVFFGTASDPPPVGTPQSQATYDPGILESNTTYYWKIEASDPDGETAVGPVWSFSTEDNQGIFAALDVLRYPTYYDGTVYYDDQITARFDSSYSPEYPLEPLQADAVYCNEYTLEWSDLYELHMYTDPAHEPFIQHGRNYTFEVVGNEIVPSLIDDVTYPDCSPYITNIAEVDTLSFDGFDVEWGGYCQGSVRLVIMASYQGDSTGVDFETENDGSYSFTSSDLAPMNNIAGDYYMYLILQNSRSIDAVGYDTRSYVNASSFNILGFSIE